MLALQDRQNGGSPSWYCQPFTRGQGLLRPKEAREEERPDSCPFASAPATLARLGYAPGIPWASARPAGPRAFGAGSPAGVGLEPPSTIRHRASAAAGSTRSPRLTWSRTGSGGGSDCGRFGHISASPRWGEADVPLACPLLCARQVGITVSPGTENIPQPRNYPPVSKVCGK